MPRIKFDNVTITDGGPFGVSISIDDDPTYVIQLSKSQARDLANGIIDLIGEPAHGDVRVEVVQ